MSKMISLGHNTLTNPNFLACSEMEYFLAYKFVFHSKAFEIKEENKTGSTAVPEHIKYTLCLHIVSTFLMQHFETKFF
jgi:hypothetical protein